MLANEDRVENFLEEPALAVAAQALAEERGQSGVASAQVGATAPAGADLSLPEFGSSRSGAGWNCFSRFATRSATPISVG
jgi:hypothetical protein